MTQSIQVLDQRTQRDLQYVEKMEVQLRGLETKFRQVEENHKQNIAKQYKVKDLLLEPSIQAPFFHSCFFSLPISCVSVSTVERTQNCLNHHIASQEICMDN